jgi:hypothetical protein
VSKINFNFHRYKIFLYGDVKKVGTQNSPETGFTPPRVPPSTYTPGWLKRGVYWLGFSHGTVPPPYPPRFSVPPGFRPPPPGFTPPSRGSTPKKHPPQPKTSIFSLKTSSFPIDFLNPHIFTWLDRGIWTPPFLITPPCWHPPYPWLLHHAGPPLFLMTPPCRPST